MGRIVIEGMAFRGRHGVHDAEELLGAKFVVDCELTFDFAGIPDHISATINYAEIYEIVRQETEGARRHLIERLANDIADRLLQEHPRLQSVTVRVHKPHAPIPGIFSDVYVETTQEREGKTR